MADPQQIIDFWYKEHGPEDWFKKSDEFDEKIKTRFGELYQKAAQGELAGWRETPQGRLAEIIILDQFSRNLFRGSAKAFASDEMALELTKQAITSGDDKKLSQNERWFLYLPFMHSEDLQIHEQAIEIFTELGLANVLEYEIKHKEIIERFGRYPHRNQALGRESTAEETEFLKHNSGF